MAEIITRLDQEAYKRNPFAPIVHGIIYKHLLQQDVSFAPHDIGKFVIAKRYLDNSSEYEWDWYYFYRYLVPPKVDKPGHIFWRCGLDDSGSLDRTFKLFDSIEAALEVMYGESFSCIVICEVKLVKTDQIFLAPAWAVRYDKNTQKYTQTEILTRDRATNKHLQTIVNEQQERMNINPYVIYFNGNFLGGPVLRYDGKGIAQDTREALRFETREEADDYIERHSVELELIGSDPKPLWSMPTGHTHQ